MTQSQSVPLSFFVDTEDGLSLAVRRQGNPQGPTILFIHGLGQAGVVWNRQMASELAASFDMVDYDLRGHGDSSKPEHVDAYSNPDLWASDLHAVIEATGAKQVTLVAWSLGAQVASHYLNRFGAARVRGLNVVGGATRLSAELLGPAALTYGGLLASPDLQIRSDAIANFLASCFVEQPPEHEYRRLLVINGMVPKALQIGVQQTARDETDAAWQLAPKLLVTWGDQDAHTKYEMSRRLLDLHPSAELSVYEGIGHAPFYEDAPRFNKELAAFVNEERC